MTVLGDVLEAIFRSVEAANRPPDAPVSEDDGVKLKRPWVDQLVVNKTKWSAKNEAGACLPYPS